jgi:predicted Fe-S protein YdhL (DUF1289 family)
MVLERPDSPCIARCTTAVGDNVCRGCARSFAEISNWCFMAGPEREQVWQRLPLRQPLLDIAERLGTCSTCKRWMASNGVSYGWRAG